MNKLTTAALFFLAAGILTSVTILSVYQVLFAIPLCYYTFNSIRNNEFHLPKSAYWLLAFSIVAIVSLTINWDLVPKPTKNFGRVKYFLFGALGILVLRVWVAETSNRFKYMLSNVFLISIIAASIAAIISYNPSNFETSRAKGFTDTMRYGYGSGMLLLSLLSALLQRHKLKEWFDSRLGVVAFIFGFAGMYLTFTRGAFLGFLCGLPFVLYFYKKKYGYIFGVGALIIILSLGGFYLFGNNQDSRYLVNKNNGSDNIRRSQWQAAIIATKEKPLLGWGLSNFHTQLKRIKNDYDLQTKSYNDAHAHNLFLEVSSGTGLIGLFIFIGWIFMWARESYKKDVVTKGLVIPFCVAWIISSQFEVTFDANNASMIFFLYALSSRQRVHV